MDNTLPALSRNLAANIAAFRRKRNLSQAALARAAGLPRSTLTNLESGSGNPSLQNLAKLSAALQVSLEALLANPRPRILLARAAKIKKQSRAQGLADIFKLLPDPIPGMEIDRLELKPGARFAGVPHLAHTKEYLICISGNVTVAVAGESATLAEGDVLAFPGDEMHSYANTGRKPARCLSVVVLAPPGI